MQTTAFLVLVCLLLVQLCICQQCSFDSRIPVDSSVMFCDSECKNVARNVTGITTTKLLLQNTNGGYVTSHRLAISQVSTRVSFLMQVERNVLVSNKLKSVEVSEPSSVLVQFTNSLDSVAAWVKVLGNSSSIYGSDVIANDDDNILVVAAFSGSITLNGKNYKNFGSIKDAIFLLLSTQGDVLWAKQIYAFSSMIPVSVASINEFYYSTGTFDRFIHDEDLSPNRISVNSTRESVFVLKISPSGTTLNRTILTTIASSTSQITSSRVVNADTDDHVTVVGAIDGYLSCEESNIPTDICSGFDKGTVKNGQRDLYIAQYDPDLTIQSIKRFAFGASIAVTGLAVDGDGYSYVTFYTQTSLTSIAYILAVNRTGDEQWRIKFSNTPGRSFDCLSNYQHLFCGRSASTQGDPIGAYITKIDKQTGVIVETKTIYGDSIGLFDFQLDLYDNMYTTGQFSTKIQTETDVSYSSSERREGLILKMRDGCDCDTVECLEPICFGRRASDPIVCSGRGVCLAYNNCSCPTGSIGTQCEETTCNGISSRQASSVCNGQGNCVEIDVCECKPGYTGQFCEQVKCEKGCGETGTCVAPNVCKCLSSDNSFYTGGSCLQKVSYVAEPFALTVVPKFTPPQFNPTQNNIQFAGLSDDLAMRDRIFNLVITSNTTVLTLRSKSSIYVNSTLTGPIVTPVGFRVVNTVYDETSQSIYALGYVTYRTDFRIVKYRLTNNQLTLEWSRRSQRIPSLEGDVYGSSIQFLDGLLFMTGSFSGSFLFDSCLFRMSELLSTYIIALTPDGFCKFQYVILSQSGFNLATQIQASITAHSSYYTTYQLALIGAQKGGTKIENVVLQSNCAAYTVGISVNKTENTFKSQLLWFGNLYDAVSTNESCTTIPIVKFIKDSYQNIIIASSTPYSISNALNNITISNSKKNGLWIVKYDSQGSNIIWSWTIQNSDITLQDISTGVNNNIVVLFYSNNTVNLFTNFISSITVTCQTAPCAIVLWIDQFGYWQDAFTTKFDGAFLGSVALNTASKVTGFSATAYSVKNESSNLIMQQYSIVGEYMEDSVGRIVSLSVIFGGLGVICVFGFIIICITILILGTYFAVQKLYQVKAVLNATTFEFSGKLITQDMIKQYEDIKESVEIGNGASATVKKAKIGNESCAVKLLKTDFFSMNKLNIYYLKQELNIMLHFKRPRVANRLKQKYGVSTLGIIDLKYIISGGPEKCGYAMTLADTTLDKYVLDIQFNYYNKYMFVRALLASIAMMHHEGVIHRDLKPENILVFNNQPVICDFGKSIYHSFVKKLSPVTKVDFENDNFGTAGYKAPESKYSYKTDMYSFGKIIEELFFTNTNSRIVEQDMAKFFKSEQLFEEQNCGPNANYIVQVLMEAINSCTDQNPSNRPSADKLFAKFKVFETKPLDIASFDKIDIRGMNIEHLYNGRVSIISKLIKDNQSFAVKEYRDSSKGYDRMIFEMKTLHRLMSTNIDPSNYYVVKLSSVIRRERINGYMMPLAEETLEAYCRQLIEPKFTECYKIASKIIDNVRYIHQMGVIHRNIHPRHILLYNKIPILTDFYYCISALSGEYSLKTDWENFDLEFRDPNLDDTEYKIYTYAYDVYSVGVLFEKYLFKHLYAIEPAATIEYKKIARILKFIKICKESFQARVDRENKEAHVVLGELWTKYCEMDDTTIRVSANYVRSNSYNK